MKKFVQLAALAALAVAVTLPASAAAIRNAGSFTTVLPANDDGSSPQVNLGFNVNFYGLNDSNVYVNNGNVTFDAALSAYTPFNLTTTTRQMLAPFFADVDTRGAGTSPVTYGAAVLGGKNVFGVNWINVGAYNAQSALNSFQLIITSRADIGVGDFDFEFNYDTIVWDFGQATASTATARAGWTNGSTSDFELAGSGTPNAFKNGGVNALRSGSLNSNVAGRYIFNVRNGAVAPPGTVPEPGSLALVALALMGAGFAARRRAC